MNKPCDAEWAFDAVVTGNDDVTAIITWPQTPATVTGQVL